MARWPFGGTTNADRGEPPLRAADILRDVEQFEREVYRAQMTQAQEEFRQQQQAAYDAMHRRMYAQALAQANVPGGLLNVAAGGLGPRAFAPFMAGPSPDAVQRARQLLSRLLTPGQRRQWAAHGSFIEKGADGASYVLNAAGLFRIDPETGERQEYWCVQMAPDLPPEDAIIGRLLHLRNDPKVLRQMASARPMAPS